MVNSAVDTAVNWKAGGFLHIPPGHDMNKDLL